MGIQVQTLFTAKVKEANSKKAKLIYKTVVN